MATPDTFWLASLHCTPLQIHSTKTLKWQMDWHLHQPHKGQREKVIPPNPTRGKPSTMGNHSFVNDQAGGSSFLHIHGLARWHQPLVSYMPIMVLYLQGENNLETFAFSNDFTFFSYFLAVSVMRGSYVYSLLKFINLHVCRRNFFFQLINNWEYISE